MDDRAGAKADGALGQNPDADDRFPGLGILEGGLVGLIFFVIAPGLRLGGSALAFRLRGITVLFVFVVILAAGPVVSACVRRELAGGFALALASR